MAECLGFLRFWLRSIYMHAHDEASGTCAPVLLLGTCGDVVHNEASCARRRRRYFGSNDSRITVQLPQE